MINYGGILGMSTLWTQAQLKALERRTPCPLPDIKSLHQRFAIVHVVLLVDGGQVPYLRLISIKSK
jgi:hypothetical protein